MKREPLNMNIDELTKFLIQNGMFENSWNIGGEVLRHWNTPTITLIDPDEKSNTIFFDFTTERIKDGLIHKYQAQVDFRSL